MSSTSDLPKISKSESLDKRKPSTAGAIKARKPSSASKGPAPPKTGLPNKSPRKASQLKGSGSEDEKSVTSNPETKQRLQSVKPSPVPPSGAPTKKMPKKKHSTALAVTDGINLLASKSASGTTKADVIVDMFQQNVAAWKIRFFIEVVVRKQQAAKFAEEKSAWKKQVKTLHKKYTESKEELVKAKAAAKASGEGGGPNNAAQTAAAAAAAIGKAHASRVGELEAELIAVRAEKRELAARLEMSSQRSKDKETPEKREGEVINPNLEALREELDASRTKLYEMTQEKNSLILELEKRALNDNSSETKLQQAHETIRLLGGALDEFKTRSSIIEEASHAKAAERQNIYAELEEASAKIKALEVEKDELSVRAEKNSSERRSLERLVTEITVNMHSREKRVADYKTEAETKNKTIEDLTFKLSNHKEEVDMMAKRLVNAEAMQRNAMAALHRSRNSEDRALMKTADLEGQLGRVVRNLSSAKQYSQLLEEQMSVTKKQALQFEKDVHSKLAAAQKQAEETEKAASAYLQGSLSQRGSVAFAPSVSMYSQNDELNDADYTIDELERAANSRVMNGTSLRSAGAKIGSPFPSGRTYGIPNYISPRSDVGFGDSFSVGGSLTGHGGTTGEAAKNPVEERLVALVSVLENRIDKIDYMTQLIEEENLGDEDKEDDILLAALEGDIESPEVAARRFEAEKTEELRRKKAEEKLLVLTEHKEVLLRQEQAMQNKVALAEAALDEKHKELHEIKGDLTDLQGKMSAMEETNLMMLAELQEWEDEVIATTGEAPTDEERLERAGRLLEGDKQLHHSFELTQEVAKEITSIDAEVTKLMDALAALKLQKDVLSALLNDHQKLEDGVRADIKEIDRLVLLRKEEALRVAEEKEAKKRQIDEKLAVRERKKKLLEDKRAARNEKINSFKRVEIPAILSKSMVVEDGPKSPGPSGYPATNSALARSLPENRFNFAQTAEEREISDMADSVHNVGDRIADLLASINNINYNDPEDHGSVSAGNSVVRNKFQDNRDEEVYFHYAGNEESTFGETDNGRGYLQYPLADPGALAIIDRGNVHRHPQQLKAYERVNEYDRRGVSSPFDFSDNPQEMAERVSGLHDHLKGLAYRVGECRLCLDRVTFHIRPKRLEAVHNWAMAFEEQWGRSAGPADCRSAASWPLIEAYIRTQRKEYEMYLEVQSLCNEGRFQLKTLQTMQTNYKLMLKSLVNQGSRVPTGNLAAYYDESKLPVTSDDIYELHAAFAPLMPPVFDDPVRSLFSGNNNASPSAPENIDDGEFSLEEQPSTYQSIHQSIYGNGSVRSARGPTAADQIYPSYDPKESVFSTRAGIDPLPRGGASAANSISEPFNFSISLESDGGMIFNDSSLVSRTTSDTAMKNKQREIKEQKKINIRSHIENITGPPPEEVAMDELYNKAEDLQGELDEALSLLQDAKEEYRRQLSRQEFATRELEAWEVAFCQKNPGKIPGQLNEDEKRFGGGGALYDTLEKQIQESETQRRRVEALVDIAVEKQLLVDDKTEELRVLQEKYAEITRQKEARGKDRGLSNSPIRAAEPPSAIVQRVQKEIAAAPAHGVIRPAGANTEGHRRMSVQDMVVLDAGPAGWGQAQEDVTSEIGRIKSEIAVVETFIGPCEDSLDQFRQRKKKLKQMANYWIDEYKQKHNNHEPSEDEKRAEIGAIYQERSEIQVREQLLNSQRDQALEILEKLSKVLEQKETRLNLIKANLKASSPGRE